MQFPVHHQSRRQPESKEEEDVSSARQMMFTKIQSGFAESAVCGSVIMVNLMTVTCNTTRKSTNTPIALIIQTMVLS